MIPLTKTADERDYVELAEELKIVDLHFNAASPQHPMRRWEYAMALRAQALWYDKGSALPQGPIIDVGGAGSPFWRMVNYYACKVVDPLENVDLAEHLRLGAGLASEVFCLSVIEHVPDDDVDRFIYHLSSLVAPGGLLFLTMDACDHDRHALDVPDPHHFSWMRSRIYGPRARYELALQFIGHHFMPLGEIDRAYHGPTVYDYTFCSLALIKRS